MRTWALHSTRQAPLTPSGISARSRLRVTWATARRNSQIRRIWDQGRRSVTRSVSSPSGCRSIMLRFSLPEPNPSAIDRRHARTCVGSSWVFSLSSLRRSRSSVQTARRFRCCCASSWSASGACSAMTSRSSFSIALRNSRREADAPRAPRIRRTVNPRSLTRIPSLASWWMMRKHSSGRIPASSISSSVLSPSGVPARNKAVTTARNFCQTEPLRSALSIRSLASCSEATRRLAGNTLVAFSLRFRKLWRSSQATAVVTLVEASGASMSMPVPKLCARSSFAEMTISCVPSFLAWPRKARSRPTKSRCDSWEDEDRRNWVSTS